jgi:hypothetical protein
MEVPDQSNEASNLSQDLIDLDCLIGTILDYYATKASFTDKKEGERWKENTKFEEKNEIIPEIIDQKIKNAFLIQLTKFVE